MPSIKQRRRASVLPENLYKGQVVIRFDPLKKKHRAEALEIYKRMNLAKEAEKIAAEAMNPPEGLRNPAQLRVFVSIEMGNTILKRLLPKQWYASARETNAKLIRINFAIQDLENKQLTKKTFEDVLRDGIDISQKFKIWEVTQGLSKALDYSSKNKSVSIDEKTRGMMIGTFKFLKDMQTAKMHNLIKAKRLVLFELLEELFSNDFMRNYNKTI